MPRGAVHAANSVDKMKSERSKRSGENLYSTGFDGLTGLAQQFERTAAPRRQDGQTYHEAESDGVLLFPAFAEADTHCSAFSKRISNSKAKFRRDCACNLH